MTAGAEPVLAVSGSDGEGAARTLTVELKYGPDGSVFLKALGEIGYDEISPAEETCFARSAAPRESRSRAPGPGPLRA